MEKKNLQVKQYKNLIFKCINLTELHDESIYTNLKKNTQREYLLLVFLYNLVSIYINYYWNSNLCGEKMKEIYSDKKNFTTNELFFSEMREFKNFIELEINKFRLEGLKQIINCRYIPDAHSMFYKVFDLYDEQFNSKIILEKLCGIEITEEQFYSVILYFFDKQKYLAQMLEPLHNARSIIIKNYYKNYDPYNIIGAKLPLKNPKGIEYIYENEGSGKVTYVFDEKFKETILSEDWSDGYNFWWKETDENDLRKNKNYCLKYFVEILDPHENQLISMTITKNPHIPNEQIHFYIKKNLITQIRSFVENGIQYYNISLLLHSYACWLFNANVVYSNLLNSMEYIFKKNNMIVELVNDQNIINAEFCIRGILHKIIITEEFKNLWFNNYDYKELINNPLVKIYKLESKNYSIDSFKSEPSTDTKSALLKYLKYKKKYLQLKNKSFIT